MKKNPETGRENELQARAEQYVKDKERSGMHFVTVENKIMSFSPESTGRPFELNLTKDRQEVIKHTINALKDLLIQ